MCIASALGKLSDACCLLLLLLQIMAMSYAVIAPLILPMAVLFFFTNLVSWQRVDGVCASARGACQLFNSFRCCVAAADCLAIQLPVLLRAQL